MPGLLLLVLVELQGLAHPPIQHNVRAGQSEIVTHGFVCPGPSLVWLDVLLEVVELLWGGGECLGVGPRCGWCQCEQLVSRVVQRWC